MPGTSYFDQIKLSASTALEIAAGAIIVTQQQHTVLDEGGPGAGADDLDTITKTAVQDGDSLLLRPRAGTSSITLRHGVGNIQCPDGQNITIQGDNDYVWLEYNDTNWVVIAFSKSLPQYNVIAVPGLGVPLVATILITAGTGDVGAGPGNYDLALPAARDGIGRYEVVDAVVQSRSADGGTAQVQTGAGVAITDAMACALLDVVARAGTIDSINSVIAAGSNLRVNYSGGSGAGRGLVTVTLIPQV